MSVNTVLATDCGSTTTKAILFERKSKGWRMTFRGEAPTTVEAPFDDVTIGARNAFSELEELSGRKLFADGGPILPGEDGRGADLYVSTSSAGGGLQMMVGGVVKTMTAASAERCALGAGAIVMDVVAVDDGRKPHERVRHIRELRPDIVLLAGGVEGGTVTHVVELAESLLSASPRPRFGRTVELPVVYAGNSRARHEVERLLSKSFALKAVANIRPTMDSENLAPARAAIHDVFLEHVMSHAPGYDRLMDWASTEIMPTPHAVGRMVQAAARGLHANVVAVDIGGATTDVFSVFGDEFHRTVSANLGMSYSIGNVLREAGLRGIMRWLPFEVAEAELRDFVLNKTIRPTTIPQTLRDLRVEQAVAREALRLALAHHRALAVSLRGVVHERTIAEVFTQEGGGRGLVDMMRAGLIIGSGGVLSHAPERRAAALMLIDAFQPEGVTNLAVDSVFMMPHLGALSEVDEAAAIEILRRDCLVRLGACVAPRGRRKRPGTVAARVRLKASGEAVEKDVVCGRLERVEFESEAELEVEPARGYDCGEGPGRRVVARVWGGDGGLVLDGRGRPLAPSREMAAQSHDAIRLGF